MKKRSLLFIFFCILTIAWSPLFLTSCKKNEVKLPERPVERVVNVKTQTADKASLRPFIETIGNLNPYEELFISAEVGGILKAVKVDRGTDVTKGTILAIIDDTDYTLEVQKAEATVKRAEAAVRQAEAAVKQAKASLSNTELQYQRKRALLLEQLIPRRQFDDISTRVLIAKSDVTKAEATLSLAKADVERAKVTLKSAEHKLTKTRIYSPLIGVIKEKKVSAGAHVRSGSHLFTITQNNPIRLNFTVTARDMGKIRKGQDVSFVVTAFPYREFKGRVNIIHPSLDEKTRTLRVEALVPNQNRLLKPGLFAHVTLYINDEQDTILVPAISLLYDGNNIKVFVVENNRAKEILVETGKKHGEMIEITEGLKGGEQVIVVGQHNISTGVKVNVAR